MFKSYKASDEQWTHWIRRSSLNAEKTWAVIFFSFSGISLLAFVFGAARGDPKLMSSVHVVMPFAIMGIAKLNNFRLYRIIQSLAQENDSKEPNKLKPQTPK